MNICKKIISTICASVFAFSCFGFNVSADEDSIASRIYRTSVEGTSSGLYYVSTLEAYPNGRIHIEVNTVKEYDHSNRIIGKYSFNDTYIQLYNESTDNNKSSESTRYGCYTTYSYNNDNIVYTLSTEYVRTFTYRSDLYVRKQYLETTIPFSFFGQDIEIPFGTVPIQTDNKDLQDLIVSLKSENEQLNKKNIELNTRNTELESANTELNSLKVQNYALSSSIVKLENENEELSAKIDSFNKMDFDGDELLTNADAQMILVYYTDSLVGKTTGKVEDYSEYVKQISG